MLLIQFRTNKLAKACSNEKEGIKKLGPECAKKLRARMSDLDAAHTLADMRNLPGRLHELSGDRKGQFSLDLKNPYRLLFRPLADPPPRTDDGSLDYSQIDSIIIEEIADTH